MSLFQIVVLGIFCTLVLVGVGVFSVVGGLGGQKSVGQVTLWGTMEKSTIEQMINTLRAQDKSFDSVTYIQKNASTYTSDLTNAMASGVGPDLFLVSLTDLQFFTDKIIPIPYSAVSQATFLKSFVDEGQLFLTPQGILALPFTVDPLVMYWNRDMFATAGVANPPTHWNDFLELAPKITSLDSTSQVKKSAVALGEWRNVTNAKGILAALFNQAGDSVTRRDGAGALAVVLGQGAGGSSASESVLRFYTEFANPSKTSYSWNRSLQKSTDAFVAGNVAVYFGFASEYRSFGLRNPNLRFSIAELPQIEGSSIHTTFAKMQGLSISRTARNPSGALVIARGLTSAAAANVLLQATVLPPVRRDVVVQTEDNAAMKVFIQSALISRGMLEPSPTATDGIFQTMVESVISGQNTPAAAVAEAAGELRKLLK